VRTRASRPAGEARSSDCYVIEGEVSTPNVAARKHFMARGARAILQSAY
jgi:hypothetical protein